MEWTIVSQGRDELTERTVTDDGEVLYRSVWFVGSLRLGVPATIATAMVATRYDPALAKGAPDASSLELPRAPAGPPEGAMPAAAPEQP